MKVIIIGRNRVEMGTVKTRDLNKHYYMTHNQLYKVYPDGLTRCKIMKYGRTAGDDEIITYKENAVKPYHPHDQIYTAARLIAEIDEHKLMKKQSTMGATKAGNEITDYYRLSAVLRSVSAFEAYRDTYREGVDERRVAELLILDPTL